jgi:hypothetical protein
MMARRSEREALKRTIWKLLVRDGVMDQRQVARRLDAPFGLVTELMAELEAEGKIVPAPRGRKGRAPAAAPQFPAAVAARPPVPAADPMTALRNLWEVAGPKYTLTVLHLVEKWKGAHPEDRDFRAGIVVGFVTGVLQTFGDGVSPWWYAEIGKYQAWREFFDQAVRHRWPEGPPKPPEPGPAEKGGGA